jgi:outer membrane protein assembly factor BamB
MTSYPYTRDGQTTNAKYFLGGVLSTAGNVVFGGLGERFVALDADTGSELWRANTGGEIKAAPITFVADGKQLVTGVDPWGETAS